MTRTPLRLISISRFSLETQKYVLGTATVSIIIWSAYMEEWFALSLTDEKNLKKHISWFMTCAECSLFAIFAWLEDFVQQEDPESTTNDKRAANPPVTHIEQIFCASLLCFSRVLNNQAVLLISYTTLIVFCQLKLFFCLIIKSSVFGESDSWIVYLESIIIIVAATCYGLGDARDEGFELRGGWIGLAIILVGKVIDSLHAVTQSYMIKKSSTPIHTIVKQANFIVAVMAFGISVAMGELAKSIEFMSDNLQSLPFFIARTFCIYLGVITFLRFQNIAGVTVGQQVMSWRKVLSIILSLFIFSKPFNHLHGFGTVFVFMAALTKMIPRHAEKKKDV